MLPTHCWLDNDYRPMQARFNEFLDRNAHSAGAAAVVAAEPGEIALYERHADVVSYRYYLARKIAA